MGITLNRYSQAGRLDKLKERLRKPQDGDQRACYIVLDADGRDQNLVQRGDCCSCPTPAFAFKEVLQYFFEGIFSCLPSLPVLRKDPQERDVKPDAILTSRR